MRLIHLQNHDFFYLFLGNYSFSKDTYGKIHQLLNVSNAAINDNACPIIFYCRFCNLVSNHGGMSYTRSIYNQNFIFFPLERELLSQQSYHLSKKLYISLLKLSACSQRIAMRVCQFEFARNVDQTGLAKRS